MAFRPPRWRGPWPAGGGPGADGAPGDGGRNRYEVVVRRRRLAGLLGLPAGPADVLLVAWLAERAGGPPALPHWRLPEALGLVLLHADVHPAAPRAGRGGATAWRARGEYAYLVAPHAPPPAPATLRLTTPAAEATGDRVQWDRALLAGVLSPAPR